MIKAEDLRIGNYINNGIEDIEINSIEYDNEKRKFNISWDEFRAYDYLEDCEPIQLTEEILLDMGFKKIGSNYEKDWLLLHTNIKTGTIDFLLNEPHTGKYKATVLEYVHQLMNLYHSLTGKELTLTSQNRKNKTHLGN